MVESPAKKPAVRRQLPHFSTMAHLLEAFDKAKRIVFITGAGVSVSCGIPDFRSSTGIYNTMECQEIGIPSPELLFDLEFFLMDPKPFYKYAHNLIPVNREPSAAHKFISLLESKKKLLRNYTQNIDGLEKACGQKKVVECHGSMEMFQCIECRKKFPLSEVQTAVQDGAIPYCQRCPGVLKPMITFFGERSPSNATKFAEEDMNKCDLIVVMGTSLKVGGVVVELLSRAKKDVPQVLINLNPISPPSSLSSDGFDISVLGECDDVVNYISDMIQLYQDKEELENKRKLLKAKIKKTKCKFCKNSRILNVVVSNHDLTVSSPETDTISPEDIIPPRTQRRTRKPSIKAIENYNVEKGRKSSYVSRQENMESVECFHCKQDVVEWEALAASMQPSSNMICIELDNHRQFRIEQAKQCNHEDMTITQGSPEMTELQTASSLKKRKKRNENSIDEG